MASQRRFSQKRAPDSRGCRNATSKGATVETYASTSSITVFQWRSCEGSTTQPWL